MRTLRDRRPLRRSAAALIELGDCALQSVELGRDFVERHRLRGGVGGRKMFGVETMNRGWAMLNRRRVTAGEGRPRDARAA
jgi:hypothetical protein